MNKKYANHLLNTGGTNERTVYHRRRSPADFECEPQQVLSDHPRSEQRTENTELRGKVRSYEDVIQRNNLWRFFHPLREKAVTRDEAR